jgi:hypothetical protein
MSSGEWGLVGVILGGLITAALGGYFGWLDRRRDRRVAARVFYGDIAVAEAICKQVVGRRRWPDLVDFGPAIATWREFRGPFGAGVTALEWTQVGAFYSNLERFDLMVRRGEGCSDGDIVVAEFLLSLAPDALAVAARHTARSERERREVISELAAPGPEPDEGA